MSLSPLQLKLRILRLKKEKAKRLAEDSLASYIRQSWGIIEPQRPYKHNWHIDVISEHLEAVSRREIRNLIINIPPRCSKSTVVSVCWPTWVWGPAQMMGECFLTASYSDKLVVRDAVKSRRIVENSWYKENWGSLFWGDVTPDERPSSILRPDQNEKMKYENIKSGYRISTTQGGLGTGAGGDTIILDDPHKISGIESETQRQATLDWWDNEMSSRFEDPTRGCRVIIMQRVHHLDICGHVLEKGDGNWEHLVIPFEYEKKISIGAEGTSIYNPEKDDPRKEEGENIWPERFDKPAVRDLKSAMTVYQQSGQLQQRPTPKSGVVFKREWFRKRWQTLPEFIHVLQCWDLTFGESETSAYNVGYTLGLCPPNIYVIDEMRLKMDINGQLKHIPQFKRRHKNLGVREILVEDAANGKATVGILSKKIPGLILVKPVGSKEDRAASVTYLFKSGNVLFPPDDYGDWSTPPDNIEDNVVEEAIEEIIGFGPKARYRDRVDALVHGIEELTKQMDIYDFDLPVMTKEPTFGM